MPDDRRVNLSDGLNKVSDDLLDSVRAAAAEVKQLQEAGARKEANAAQRVKSKRISGLVIAAAALVLVLISYWAFFVRADNSALANQATAPQTASQATKIKNPVMPGTTRMPGTAAPRPAPRAGGHNSQVVEHPSDELEQPSADPGM